MAQHLIDNQGAPSSPAAGKSILWVDNGTGGFVATDSTGRHKGSLSRNDSTASQTGFAADQYITNSGILIPSFGIKAGQQYKWTFDVKKTAAGVAAAAVIIRIGPNQTTADAGRLTLTADVIQTAAIAAGLMTVMIGIRNSGAAGVLAGGFGIAAGSGVGLGSGASGASIGFDTTILAGQYMGLSLNAGAAAAWTIQHVSAELIG